MTRTPTPTDFPHQPKFLLGYPSVRTLSAHLLRLKNDLLELREAAQTSGAAAEALASLSTDVMDLALVLRAKPSEPSESQEECPTCGGAVTLRR